MEGPMKTSFSCWLDSTALLVLFIAVTTIVTSCGVADSTSEPEPGQTQALHLMAEHNLHPSDSQPASLQFVLEANSIPFQSMATASSVVGLDLTKHAGEKVELLTYLLNEKSQANMGEIKACFVVSEGHVVGAWLALEGYVGGVLSLNERSQFLPSGLASDSLVFQGVKSVNVLGPWTVINWKSEVELSDPESIKRLLTSLEASKKQNGVRFSVQGDEEYAMRINYETGEVVLVSLTTKSGSADTFLTFSPFADCYFIPSDELKPYVKDLLAVP
jgi:hypothetical protein